MNVSDVGETRSVTLRTVCDSISRVMPGTMCDQRQSQTRFSFFSDTGRSFSLQYHMYNAQWKCIFYIINYIVSPNLLLSHSTSAKMYSTQFITIWTQQLSKCAAYPSISSAICAANYENYGIFPFQFDNAIHASCNDILKFWIQMESSSFLWQTTMASGSWVKQ